MARPGHVPAAGHRRMTGAELTNKGAHMSHLSDGRITDPAVIAAVLAYCNARPGPCWAVHTPPESAIGGVSVRLAWIEEDHAVVEIANGDKRTVPMAEIHLRAA
jgi:hypothetical protein